MRYSVLDQSPIAEGSAPRDALRETLRLARRAEELGYHRYWVAEHHATPALACASPEILISAIASETSTIRIGSGGVMLPHYSPFKVAEVFSMLAGLHPSRIDLGIGRAAGTDRRATVALQRDRTRNTPDDFPSQLAETLGYLGDDLPEDYPFRSLARTLPGLPEVPAPWLLGSSEQSAIWAAEAGLPYAFADFINPSGAAYVKRYRENFRPSIWSEEPEVIAAVWVTCAESEEEAVRLSSSARMLFRLLGHGELITVPSPEKALAWLDANRSSSTGRNTRRRRNIVGAPSKVTRELAEAANEYGADELMIISITWEPSARVRSYELIARELGLESKRLRTGDSVAGP